MRNVLATVLVGAAVAWSAWSASASPDRPVPPVSEAAAAAGLIDVRTVVTDAIVDLRYATENNFVGEQMYPAGARCLVHESIGPGLAAAADALRTGGEVLVFWDCYRPRDVQARMYEAVPELGWVSRPTASGLGDRSYLIDDGGVAMRCATPPGLSSACSPAGRCCTGPPDAPTSLATSTPRL